MMHSYHFEVLVLRAQVFSLSKACVGLVLVL
jgi:hypothetical protein